MNRRSRGVLEMEIRKYNKGIDETRLMDLIRNEGEEWSCYWNDEASQQYRDALFHSITYVAIEGENLLGYSRSLDDNGFYIYVCDLLVGEKHRGQGMGRKLMEVLCEDYPDRTVYVMSDEDGYYEKLGYDREGSVFVVKSDK